MRATVWGARSGRSSMTTRPVGHVEVERVFEIGRAHGASIQADDKSGHDGARTKKTGHDAICLRLIETRRTLVEAAAEGKHPVPAPQLYAARWHRAMFAGHDSLRERRHALWHRARRCCATSRCSSTPARSISSPGRAAPARPSLLRLIYLAERPSRGARLAVRPGRRPAAQRRCRRLRRRIGVIFQDFRLIDHLSTFDNVALPLRVAGADEGRSRTTSPSCSTWVGPRRPASRRGRRRLSGGQQAARRHRARGDRPAQPAPRRRAHRQCRRRDGRCGCCGCSRR